MREPTPEEMVAGWKMQWTPEDVKRFWDWQSRQPHTQELYFSRILGKDIIRQSKKMASLDGAILDFGSGPGFLVEALVAQRHTVAAADVSRASLESLSDRFEKSASFLGTYAISENHIAAGESTFDCVFLIETLEHLHDSSINEVLREIHRILRPGGILIITTPNEENLLANQAYCPNCSCVFHTVQHIQSISANILRSILTRNGFTATVCRPTLFFQGPLWRRWLTVLAHKFRYGKLPHLHGIARRNP